MTRSALLAWFFSVLLFDPAFLLGQVTAGTPLFEVEPPQPPGSRYEDVQALAFDGGFAVAWSTRKSTSTEGEDSGFLHARLLKANGRLGARLEPDTAQLGINTVDFFSLVRENTGFLFAWSGEVTEDGSAGLWVQHFSPSGEPGILGPQRLSEWGTNVWHPVAASGGSFSVVAWIERSNVPETVLKTMVFAAGGVPFTGELIVDDGDLGTAIAAGMDSEGRFVLLWWKTYPGITFSSCSLHGQRFAPDGVPLGKRFTLNTATIYKSCPSYYLDMAMAPDGSFAVVSKSSDFGAYLQSVRPDGVPEHSVSFHIGNFPIAGDRYGNLVMMRGAIEFFNHHLVDQGFLLSSGAGGAIEDLALGRQFLVAWVGPKKPGDGDSLLGRIWEIRRDADACAYRDNRFLCDTAGNGEEPDVAISFGLDSAAQIPLMGDFDGDGRDDPCLYLDGRFFCDTAQDGGLPEKRTRALGRPGDVPLLGDLDGDGRDDPCVHRGNLFLCDSNRDGALDRPIAFGVPGDLALIGNVNGDHRDDPCVVRDGRFLCDTAHNGGTAEARLSLTSALAGLSQGTPALGDSDGDGRDDPCVFTEGRLLCGLFPKGARFPASILKKTFGEPGDVLLLGDLDAF